ncbi:uncharacterized protein ASPGLDRAFT_24602 [Aspergillus glaucus CBS 516.65]|uniref:F-box domain-containing protein n=1 Tax=Aspergillus glaucus CBS 516.65 TaxID=1160497 RepID=A0A1L9VNV1_ASPGL|nr:hypothetical protein ASPGLDRAFT_24602 [Aspergillus glaucus CBS 516.65]OJJ85586.1 hypothetical protein ASPGLDRAFT_24602 [Aspergillus glaucus CBS 516.65]
MPQHLPPEILREIFTHLDNKRDLSSLCKVFRLFKEIAQPLLFRKFTLMDYSDESQTEVFRALTQFTRTVLSRTDLQSAVREINIRTGEGPDADPAYETSTLLFDTRICLPNELQKLRINEGANLMHARVILAAMTAPVMLLLCIKLKRLEVLNHLSNLTSLTLRVIPEGEEYPGGIQIEKLWPFLQLPCLQHFKVEHCISDDTQLPESGLLPNAVKASSISLGACCLDQETLITLMDSCECVNSLLYVVDPRLSRSTDRLEVDEFLEALDSHKDNITNLRVQLNNIDPIGTDYINLGNTPRLPRSLETLVVSHYGKLIFDLLDGIVEENNNYIHELKTVNFKPLFSPCTLMLDVQNEIYQKRRIPTKQQLMTNSYPPGKSYLLQIAQALTHGTPVDYMDVTSSENDGPVQNNPDTGRDRVVWVPDALTRTVTSMAMCHFANLDTCQYISIDGQYQERVLAVWGTAVH